MASGAHDSVPGAATDRAVVIVTGHVTDPPGRADPRFPEAAVGAVTARCAAVLDGWRIGPGTLGLSGGARGADIIGAELALARGAEVRLLLAADPDTFAATSVSSPGTRWEERFRALARTCATEVVADAGDGDAAFVAVNERLLTTAARAAGGLASVRVLAVWDGQPAEGAGGTAELIAAARTGGATVVVVPPIGA